ncbi:hypothetical protein [Ferruginibacter sp. SUN106]|uniref:hypothetical protein n=1 Tax=Ferruginibacter sp. SUN106 TaxID=2978348 RepID=UPI003D35FAB0
MKKIIIAFIFFILLSVAAHAQRGSGHVRHAPKKERRLKRKAIKTDRIRNHRINMNLRRQHRHRYTRSLNLAPNTTSDNK